MIITSEILKNTVVKRLLEIYSNVSVYKEAVTVPLYPHFFVNLLQIQCNEERKGIFLLDFNFEIRFRLASDPSTDLKLLSKLDEVGITLLNGFDLISFDNNYFKCTDKYYEKVDGVLHFFFNIRDMVTNSQLEEFIKMEKLKLTMELKNGTRI